VPGPRAVRASTLDDALGPLVGTNDALDEAPALTFFFTGAQSAPANDGQSHSSVNLQGSGVSLRRETRGSRDELSPIEPMRAKAQPVSLIARSEVGHTNSHYHAPEVNKMYAALMTRPKAEGTTGDAAAGRRKGRLSLFLQKREIATGLAVVCVLLGTLAFASVPAAALDFHKYEEQISESPSGKLGEPLSLTVDAGDLYVSAKDEPGAGAGGFFKFDATTGAFVSQVSLPGFGPPELGVAFGRSTSETELYASYQNAVAVFGAGVCGSLECPAFQNEWTGADTPNGSFVSEKSQGSGTVGAVAVDESAAANWAKGDVLVSTYSDVRGEHSNLNVIDVFKPEAGGNETYVTQLKGTCPSASPGQVCTLVEQEEHPFEGTGKVAVSPVNGDVVVNEYYADALDIFEPTGLDEYAFVRRLTGPSAGVAFPGILGVTVAGGSGPGAGDIFVSNGLAGVDEFDPTGELLDRITGTSGEAFHAAEAVAVDPESKRVFVGDYHNASHDGFIDVFSRTLVQPGTTMETVKNVNYEPIAHAWGVELTGSVNPEGAGPATCRFAWGSTPALGNVANCEGPGESEANPVANGPNPVGVHASLSGLAPGSTYYYRLQAANVNGTNEGEEIQNAQFATPGAALAGESVSDVASSSATLEASIAPLGSATSYDFEYDTSPYTPSGAPHGSSTPVVGIGVGVGASPIEVDRHIQGLAGDKVYHYRVAMAMEVEVELGKMEAVVFYGPDQTFTTQQPSEGAQLLDGRQWELVSPPDKHGALIFGLVKAISSAHSPTQAAGHGDGVTYTAFTPTESGAAGYSVVEQILSTRNATGTSWSSRDISPPHAAPTGLEPYPEYRLFSEDLCIGALDLTGGDATALSDQASEATPYLRVNGCEGAGESYLPLVSAKAGEDDDVPAGTVFGGTVGFIGASPDMTHVLLASSAALTEQPTEGNEELYEWSAEKSGLGRLQLVSLLPEDEGGGPAHLPVDAGNELLSGVKSVSDGGERVVWSAGGENSAALYMRDLAREKTVRLDVAQPGATGGSPHAVFQFAGDRGSQVFFTDTERLTTASSQHGADLYECEIAEASDACVLRDLTPEGPGGSSEVQNLVSGGADGSYAYFVADGVLAGSGAPSGVARGGCALDSFAETTCNLYVYHEGSVRYMATLSGEDELDWGGDSARSKTVGYLTARVSPNGRYFAFMSSRSLTGYDNRDARSGKPDAEVYLYHAPENLAMEAGALTCASCDPTGARPLGVEVGAVYANGGADLAAIAEGPGFVYGSRSWVAANLPAGTARGLYHESMYLSRLLSNSGRLFFDSSDALVPQDVNGTEDVYEYEPGQTGGCTTSSTLYHGASAGCVGLISSGTSAKESGLLDASESGEDVFFVTAEKLVPEDYDTALDVYDAHVCSEAAPCASAPPPAPPCSTVDACRVAPSPQPPLFGSPSSATFSGAGNPALTPPAPKPTAKKTVKCPKGKTRNRHGKCVAHKIAHKRKPKDAKRAKRATNDRRAGR
jgi:hypothetical protein